jgi:hypothetical protein
VRFGLRLVSAAAVIAVCGSPAAADDVGAAARGVVRVIVAAEDYSDPANFTLSFGSGFAISPHHIVTNAHVVEAAEDAYADSVVAVVPSEGSRAVHGSVIAYDPVEDLAIIDIGQAHLEPLAIYSGPVDSGEHAAALGYPGNVDRATANSMYDLITPTAPVRSEGNVSSQRSIDGTPAYLHTAAISRGNSGGPLVDECGRVLGVNTYTAVTDSGDAPFGFAIVSQQLTSFLREHGEQFRQIGTACITLAEQAQRESLARETADRQQAIAQQTALKQQQARYNSEKSAAEDSRQNHAAASAFLALLSVIAGAVAMALFIKDRTRAATASATIAAVGLAAGAYAFFSRPGLEVQLPKLTTPASAKAVPLSGSVLCQVKPNLSRVTVSSMDDVAMNWGENGCMNGRTQYVEEGETWRRILVPNGSETVYVQDFDPAKGQYISKRYLLPQADMEQMRQIRGATETKGCTSDPSSIEQLQQITEQLVSSLPTAPNENIVYNCHISSER